MLKPDKKKPARPLTETGALVGTLCFALVGFALGAARAADPSGARAADPSRTVAAAHANPGKRLAGEMALTMTVPTLKAVTLKELAGPEATVLVFLGTACPISNEYAPALLALEKAYKAKGVRFIYVYPNAGTSQGEAQKHVSGFYKASMGVWDVRQGLADAVGATVTPEVAVLDRSLTVRYKGRIDDRYVARAKARTTGARSHNLKASLDLVLAGKAVSQPLTEATGCLIERGENPAPAAPAAPAAPTYAADIAPIIQKNCQSCHRGGEIGPMPLENYEQVRQYAANIVAVTESRFMPPWKPVEGHGTFAGKRTLSDTEIAALKRWADAGAPAGDLAKAPPSPKFPRGWQLGTPDLVLTMPEKWKVEASGNDLYRCFVLPTGLTEDKDVVAVEYRAGNKRVVHHVLGYVDTTGEGKKRDAEDPGPGYTNFGGPGFLPTGEVGGWAPGNMPAFLPEGIGRKLPAGSDIILQVHYHPSGKEEEDITRIGLYFAKKPTTKTLRIFPVPYRKLNIPPGEKHYWVEATYPVPLDVNLIFVAPHMHLLGREFEMWATLPDGAIKPIVKITDWDFRWQDSYFYKEPVSLPKGSKITLKARYDNSSDNPRNPNNPPKAVGWGEATTDEMCIGFLGFVPENEDDPLIRLLEAARRRRNQ